MSGVPQGEQAAETADCSQVQTVNVNVDSGTGIGWAGKVFIKKIREHRSRILLVVAPVFMTGGAFLAGTLMPHQSAAPEHRSQGRGRPSPSGLSSPSPAGSAFPSPSPSASAVPPPPAISKATRTPSGPGGHDGAGGPTPDQGKSPAPTAQGGTPGAQPSGSGTLSPGSRSHLENVGRNQCVSGDAFFPSFGACGAGYSYSWTLRSVGDGSFALVNRASGSCLLAPNNNNYGAGLGSCGAGHDHWRTDTPTSAGQILQNTDTGTCLAIAPPPYGGGDQVLVTTCNPDDARQLWKGGSA